MGRNVGEGGWSWGGDGCRREENVDRSSIGKRFLGNKGPSHGIFSVWIGVRVKEKQPYRGKTVSQ
jgi:hypothetical protein